MSEVSMTWTAILQHCTKWYNWDSQGLFFYCPNLSMMAYMCAGPLTADRVIDNKSFESPHTSYNEMGTQFWGPFPMGLEQLAPFPFTLWASLYKCDVSGGYWLVHSIKTV